MSLATYSVPDGTGLGELLGLAHDSAEGIATKQRQDGRWDLLEWPAGLGAVPTQQQIDTLAGQVATLRQTGRRNSIKGILRSNDADGVRLRAALHVVMKSLVEVRGAYNNLRAEVIASASLADMKTRVTGLPILSNRTWQQALGAVESVIDAGQAEE